MLITINRRVHSYFHVCLSLVVKSKEPITLFKKIRTLQPFVKYKLKYVTFSKSFVCIFFLGGGVFFYRYHYPVYKCHGPDQRHLCPLKNQYNHICFLLCRRTYLSIFNFAFWNEEKDLKTQFYFLKCASKQLFMTKRCIYFWIPKF